MRFTFAKKIPNTTMKRRRILLIGFLMMVPRSLSARSFPKRDVDGTVVDVDKRNGALVLSDFNGWDREQMKIVQGGVKRAIQHLLNGVNPKHAAIFINVEDAERIKKGMRIKIAAYGYIVDYPGGGSGDVIVIPDYDKIEVTDAKTSKP
jgi:hypothetical protein